MVEQAWRHSWSLFLSALTASLSAFVKSPHEPAFSLSSFWQAAKPSSHFFKQFVTPAFVSRKQSGSAV
ncbi:MAG: hypothetical protein LBK76_09810, partial [Verrucomicrobiales bacterium]|nr:hypothetical protein [Verrucomicrobiales bacterium]